MAKHKFPDKLHNVSIQGIEGADIQVACIAGRTVTEIVCEPPDAYLVNTEPTRETYQPVGFCDLEIKPNAQYKRPKNSDGKGEGIVVLLPEIEDINELTVTTSGLGGIDLSDTRAGRITLQTGEDGEVTFSDTVATGNLSINGTLPENIRGHGYFYGDITVNGERVNSLPNVDNALEPDPGSEPSTPEPYSPRYYDL